MVKSMGSQASLPGLGPSPTVWQLSHPGRPQSLSSAPRLRLWGG